MIRRLTAVAVGSLVIPGLIVSAQSAPDRASVEKQIAANEKAVITAIAANDVKTFHSYTVADSYGVNAYHVTKVADLDPVFKAQHDACKIAKWDILEPTFYWLNDTAVVYIYKIVIDGTCEGKGLPAAMTSTVWVNKNGKWLAAFHQQSDQAPPEAGKK